MACPKCGAEDAVEFDLVLGVSACVVCGTVLDEEVLVHPEAFDDQGARAGTFVGAADTGEVAAAYALHGSGTGLAIQRSKRSEGKAKLKARVRELGALLHLQRPVVDQALHLAGQAQPRLLGKWRRELLAAAATYAACRLNSLPLTLADLSAASQAADPATLGRHYCSLCRLLELQPPLLLAPALLPRCLDRVTSEAVQEGALSGDLLSTLRRDALAMLGFMDRQLERRRYPLALVGAALVLAGEMSTVSLSLDHVCSALQLQRTTLTRTLGEVRSRLLQLSAFLPYAPAITLQNVGSHARTIVQLASLVESSTGAAAGGGAAAAGSSAAAGGGTAAGGSAGNGGSAAAKSSAAAGARAGTSGSTGGGAGDGGSAGGGSRLLEPRAEQQTQQSQQQAQQAQQPHAVEQGQVQESLPALLHAQRAQQQGGTAQLEAGSAQQQVQPGYSRDAAVQAEQPLQQRQEQQQQCPGRQLQASISQGLDRRKRPRLQKGCGASTGQTPQQVHAGEAESGNQSAGAAAAGLVPR